MAGKKVAPVAQEVKAKLLAARDAAVRRGNQAYAEAFAAMAGESLDVSKPVKTNNPEVLA